MNDYRYVQLEELAKKIAETESLMTDPALQELAQEELSSLNLQKQALEDSLKQSQENAKSDDLDTRNVLLEIKGAAGGDEASIFAEELLRMYMRFAERKGYKAEFLEDKVLEISGKPAHNASASVAGGGSLTFLNMNQASIVSRGFPRLRKRSHPYLNSNSLCPP